MKKNIHPALKVSKVKCGCGNTIEILSVFEEEHIEVCSNCHPFYTGKKKIVDTGGRVDRFKKKYKVR
ncbi:MAG: 50S ribosomal protein L31 [Spirochaetia bacterium]|nr:50S ribosomal protein L31 [Spirochaetota bacterium]MCX8096505.1 50S ribosomal protein L31 [Spirochaetota bacterium]MDW8112369.1 50S ribosomal protein L31 [Spirochaetia bacterium]